VLDIPAARWWTSEGWAATFFCRRGVPMARRKQQAGHGFVLTVTTFSPRLEKQEHEVPDAEALRRLLAPLRRRKLAAIYLQRGEEGPHLMAHISGGRAWLSYFRSLEDMEGYAFDPDCEEPAGAEGIGFRLDNGQRDLVHPYWTVPKAQAFRALEHFFSERERPPFIRWGMPARSLEEPG